MDVLFDLAVRSLLGFDVRCGDERVRFLPSRACEVVGEHVAVASPFLLIDDGFYRQHAHRLSRLVGAPVRQARRSLGPLVDVTVGDDGSATGLWFETADGEQEVSVDRSVAVAAEQLNPAV